MEKKRWLPKDPDRCSEQKLIPKTLLRPATLDDLDPRLCHDVVTEQGDLLKTLCFSPVP
jgi:hypothetical protein